MKIKKALLSRTALTALTVIIELIFLLALLHWLSPYLGWIEIVLRILSIFVVLSIVSFSRHLSSDMMWIVLIMLVPIGGTVVFIFLEVLEHFDSKTHRGLVEEAEISKKYFTQDEQVLLAAKQNEALAGQYEYLRNAAGYTVYENNGFDYYPLGEIGFEVMKEELQKAKDFIFLEYFIIEPGEMWDSLLAIMAEKAKEGVEVRILYDDMGSIGTLPAGYVKTLEGMGIKAQAFNRINPVINGIMNHRDHRKILVIDGKVGFSGGINLADEYINKKVKYGHWKDNCIRVQGEAVWSYTVIFLSIWNALRHEDEDYTKYKVKSISSKIEKDGYIVPYADTPLDNDLTGEDVYLNILNNAKKYCYIVTPYLIIDTDMTNALILTARRGVDVRIITPGIPDKKMVWRITRSNYLHLINNGVKIYEYTPGFVHAKIFVSDDAVATVGTINLDYRSLYLHFENGTALFESKKILDIRKDVEETLDQSHEMTVRECYLGVFRTFFYMVVSIFAPMM